MEELSKFLAKPKKRKPKQMYFGTGGIGKTTLATEYENPIFIVTEDGLGNLEEEDMAFPRCMTWGECLDAATKILETKHEKKTVVVDTVDGIEKLCQEYVLQNDYKGMKTGKNGFNAYAQGPIASTQVLKQFLNLLDQINNERDMEVVILAHDGINKEKDPLGEDYGIRTAALFSHSWAMFYDWCDIVGYICRDVQTYEDDGGKIKAKFKEKTRHIIFEGQAGLKVKSRAGFEMPPRIRLDYPTLREHLDATPEMKKAERTKEVEEMLASLDNKELEDKVRGFMGKNPSLTRLNQTRNRLQTIIQERK